MQYRGKNKREKDMTNNKKNGQKIENADESLHQEENVVQHQEEAAEELAGESDNAVSKEKELEEKLAESKDKYMRLAAEFDNYRRRASKERLELISTASEEVIKGLLPILDDCERALQVLKDSRDTEAAKEGTELILNKLRSYLKAKGLAEIEAQGKELDTDFHEAVAQFPAQNPAQKNKIIDVVQKGYTLNGKVVRFAKVVVGI